MGTVGAEGGEEPVEAAEPVTVGGEVEAGAEGLERSERVAGGLDGHRDGQGCGGGLEGDGAAGLELPAGGGDADDLAGGVGKVEEEGGPAAGGREGADAAMDDPADAVGVADGAGFEEVEDGAEGVGRGDIGDVGEVLAEEPVAEGGRAEGDGLLGPDVGRDRGCRRRGGGRRK